MVQRILPLFLIFALCTTQAGDEKHQQSLWPWVLVGGVAAVCGFYVVVESLKREERMAQFCEDSEKISMFTMARDNTISTYDLQAIGVSPDFRTRFSEMQKQLSAKQSAKDDSSAL
jgi:hypothetical protein